MHFYKRVATFFLLSLGIGILNTASATNTYPANAIDIIVAYGPGGQGDTFARIVSDKLAKVYQQSVLVDNRPGVSGTVGTRYAVKSKSDGYTLLLGQTGEIAVNRILIKDLRYDPVKELVPIVLIGNAPLVLLVPADAPYNNLAEFIKMAKNNKGTFSYGSVGEGTPGYLAALALSLSAGLQMIHIPYKSVGSLFTDLMGNRLHLFIASASAAIPQLKGGKLKALAVTTPERMVALPQIPTVQEVIGKPFSYTLWGGLFAPVGTPVSVIQSLNKEVNAILAMPDVKAKLDADNLRVPANSPAEFSKFVQTEAIKFERLVKDANLKIDP